MTDRTPAEKLAAARIARERVYQKWLKGEAYTSQLHGWDEYVAQLEREQETT